MQNNTHEERAKVYEIGYLFVPLIPKEKVAAETASLKEVLVKAGASVIAGEDPELIALAYQMTKKIGGVHQRFDEAYFGWVKFELSANAIESVKKSLDSMEHVLRHLLITTVKENTYLGKRSANFLNSSRDSGMITPEGIAQASAGLAAGAVSGATGEPAASEKDITSDASAIIGAASVEDMDKSIDALVKGV